MAAGRSRKTPGTSRHHYTRMEIAELFKQTPADEFKNFEAPRYLNRSQKSAFYDFAYKLSKFGICELDEDLLARYLIARDLYQKYAIELQALESKKISAVEKWAAVSKIEDEDLHKLLVKIIEKMKLDDKAALQKLMDVQFKECRACAADLGLSITDRGRLILPKDEDSVEL